MKFTKEEKQQRQDETLRVARILRAWISRKGIKVKDAAEILNVNPNTISTFGPWYWPCGSMSCRRPRSRPATPL